MPDIKTCDRCDRELGNISYTSWYNQQIICTDCRKNEQKRPDYPECRRQERLAVEKGNLNFHFLPPWKE